MRRKEFKDGVILRNLIEDFNQEKNTEKMASVLICFRDSEVVIPHLAGSDEVDLLKCDGHVYLPVYSNGKQMEGTYDDRYEGVSYTALDALELAEGFAEVEGILIDGFTNPFMVPGNLFEFVANLDSSIDDDPEDALLEVGRLSTEQTVKIAVPYEEETGKVFQHFGHTQVFKLYTIVDSDVVETELIDTQGQGHSALSAFLKERGVQFVMCGGIGSGAINALQSYGIQVFGGVDDDADDSISELLAGILVYNPDATCSHHGDGDCECSDHEEDGCGCGGDCGCH